MGKGSGTVPPCAFNTNTHKGTVPGRLQEQCPCMVSISKESQLLGQFCEGSAMFWLKIHPSKGTVPETLSCLRYQTYLVQKRARPKGTVPEKRSCF